MSTSTPSSVPAGWYHDPDSSGYPRWWDGARWTAHLMDQPSPPGHGSPSERRGEELSRAARVREEGGRPADGTVRGASSADRSAEHDLAETPRSESGRAALTPGALAAAMERLALDSALPSLTGAEKLEAPRRARWSRLSIHTRRR